MARKRQTTSPLAAIVTAERRLSADSTLAKQMLTVALANWQTLKDKDISLAEPKNDGRWVAAWDIAIREFST